MSQRENLWFLIKKFSKSLEFYHLETGLYTSITGIVEAMNNFIQEKYNQSESCITVEVTGRTQKLQIYLANKGCGLAHFSTDLGHVSGSNVGNEFRVMLRGKRPHIPKTADNLLRIHSLMIYTGLIEYNIDDDTKVSLLRCFFSFQSSKLETM